MELPQALKAEMGYAIDRVYQEFSPPDIGAFARAAGAWTGQRFKVDPAMSIEVEVLACAIQRFPPKGLPS